LYYSYEETVISDKQTDLAALHSPCSRYLPKKLFAGICFQSSKLANIVTGFWFQKRITPRSICKIEVKSILA